VNQSLAAVLLPTCSTAVYLYVVSVPSARSISVTYNRLLSAQRVSATHTVRRSAPAAATVTPALLLDSAYDGSVFAAVLQLITYSEVYAAAAAAAQHKLRVLAHF
jgi:hypothetical protein